MSAFKFTGDEKEHLHLPNTQGIDASKNIKYVTIDKSYDYDGLVYSDNSDIKAYVTINRGIGKNMLYKLYYFHTLAFSKAGFLKGDYFLFKGASYIIENYSEFEDKKNFIINLKEDKVTVKQLLLELVQDSNILYTQFLIENKILTIADCNNIIKEKIPMENSLLLTHYLSTFSKDEMSVYNKEKDHKEDLDLGIEGYSLEDFKKIFDCAIEHNRIIIKKPKLVEETVSFPYIDKISDYVFKSMPVNKVIKKIIFEEGIKRITTDARIVLKKFSELKEIYLPKSIEYFDDVIIKDLPKGVKIYSDLNQKDFAVVNNEIIYSNVDSKEKEIIIPEGVEYIKDGLFEKHRTIHKITFPSTIKKIGEYMFVHKGIKTLNFTQPLVNELIIEEGAFVNNKILDLVIPKGVISIGMYAFTSAPAFNKIQLDKENNNFNYVDGALYNKEFTRIIAVSKTDIPVEFEIKDGITCIESGLFTDCKCTSIKIPSSVKKIGREAFSNTHIKTIALPEIEEIETETFNNCKKLEIVVLPNSVTKIGYAVFANCKKLKHVVWPANFKKIPDSTFLKCSSMEEFIIPQKVTDIGSCAFQNCDNLKEIIIPSNVQSISGRAFEGCSSLKEIFIPISVSEIYHGAFDDINGLIINAETSGKDSRYRYFLPTDESYTINWNQKRK